MPPTDVLLATPPVRTIYRVPPVGLGLLASCLRAAGLVPGIADCPRDRMDAAGLVRRVDREGTRLLGIQVFSAHVPAVNATMAALRGRTGGHVRVLAGGPHVTGRGAARALEDMPLADLAFEGEAEESIGPIARALLSARNGETGFQGIRGVAWREAGGIRDAGGGPVRVEDLDRLPLPAWDLMDPRAYPARPHGGFFRGWPIGPLLTARGCPYGCRFCASPVTSGRSVRPRGIDAIFEEMRILTRGFRVREIHVLDDAFTASRLRVAEFFERSIREHPGLHYAFPNGVRIETLDRELILLMKRAGVYSFTIGIESGSQRVLDAMGKGLSVATVREKVALMNDLGIRPHAFLILGFPGETREDAEATIRLTRDLALGRVHFSNFLPLPGTPITRDLERSGRLEGIDWSSLAYARASFPPAGMSPLGLKRLQRRAIAGYYSSPGRLLALLKELRSFDQVVSVAQRGWDYLARG